MPTDLAADTIASVPLSAITESPTNPRKAFDKAPLTELAEDIARRGILQPLLLRPAPQLAAKAGTYELVFGHRRFRAAKLAGLKLVPAMVRTLSDAEVLEVQLMENLKRADLHPLEAADGYRQLHEVHGLSVEEVAKRVGKSASTIYQALSVSRLGTKQRKAWLAGELGAGVARLLARIPTGKSQDAAFVELADTWQGRALNSVEEAERVTGRFMRPLSKAAFPQDDAQLAAKCGTCIDCPKRSDAQAALFSEVKGPALCLDVGCWDAKLASWWKQQEALGKAGEGPRCLSATMAKETFGKYGGSSVQHGSPYLDLDSKCANDSKGRTWAKLLGKEAKALTVQALSPSGDVVRLVDAKVAQQVLKKAGTLKSEDRVAFTSSSGEKKSKAQVEAARKERAEARLREAVTDELVARCIASIEDKQKDMLDLLPFLARLAAETLGYKARQRRKLQVETTNPEWLDRVEAEAMGDQLGLLLERLLADILSLHHDDDYAPALKRACDVLEVDMGEVEATKRAEFEGAVDEV
jgi:ParB/RepB/Spo0J family partition protein